MKRTTLLLLVCIPLLTWGQQQKTSIATKYLAGGVPEIEGEVVFSKSFITSDTKDVSNKCKSFLAALVNARNPLKCSAIITDSKNKKHLAARISEVIYFEKSKWVVDSTIFNYLIEIKILKDETSLKIHNIKYLYDMNDPNRALNVRAEKWITDKEGLNKKKTKLAKVSGKFRMKTIDRINEIFKTFSDFIAQ